MFRIPALLAIAMMAALPACQSVSIVDEAQLGKPAMSFDNTGAGLAACGLTSQLERGRTLVQGAAGGGCASCH
ncbi:hypothetical protein N9C66_07910 [Akkermansiaceae bacterium]|jgi:cytochrome c peroxidase|nr:hypothetical protein [bacterium]MDA7907661.1 hypothetical protein [Akkermansiaceae bacterium]MDA7929304.1 hypothetical protein [Akkermansiaceae bacterium]MDA7933582.1 hypothetical protein [Akkermansiaceae bacterium]MDA9831252.1 hypothetical protein [Akkermansiaceae bacterium]